MLVNLAVRYLSRMMSMICLRSLIVTYIDDSILKQIIDIILDK
jgi:hypothetical protein